MSESPDLVEAAMHWLAAGRRIILATLVHSSSSSPLRAGSMMLVCENGDFRGAVSAGCLEAEIITEALEMLQQDETFRCLEFNDGNKQTAMPGLACGAKTTIMLRRETELAFLAPRTLTNLANGERREITAEDNPFYRKCRDAVKICKTALLNEKGTAYFVQRLDPPTRLVVIGAVQIAVRLAAMSYHGGFDVIIIDPRAAFATASRFPGAKLVAEWPGEALAELELQQADALIALSHNPEFDDIALAAAIKAGCFYIGALGSRKSHYKRLERLKKIGLSDTALEKIHGPVGLDIGAKTPEEIAVSILAEIISTQNNG